MKNKCGCKSKNNHIMPVVYDGCNKNMYDEDEYITVIEEPHYKVGYGCEHEDFDYTCNPPKKKNKVNYSSYVTPNYYMAPEIEMEIDIDIDVEIDMLDGYPIIDSLKGYNDDNEEHAYVEPFLDMSPMQYMGGMCDEYPSMEMPYMDMNMCQNMDMNQIWMSYFKSMKNMQIMLMDHYNSNK